MQLCFWLLHTNMLSPLKLVSMNLEDTFPPKLLTHVRSHFLLVEPKQDINIFRHHLNPSTGFGAILARI